VHSSAAPPYQDDLSLFLDDIIHELSVLIDQRPPAEKRIPYTLSTPAPAAPDLLYALEAANCLFALTHAFKNLVS
jgi:ubiquitin carboxyl-terminal hydrolase 25/28